MLVLRILAEGGPILDPAIERLASIEQARRRHHRWIGDAADLPASAALTLHRGSPQAIVAEVEGISERLQVARLDPGDALQRASNLLALARRGVDQPADRFLALAAAYRGSGMSVMPVDYQALALLALLDHDPQRVLERFLVVIARIDDLIPRMVWEATANLAAELTFLDLVRFDRQMRSFDGGDGREILHEQIRLQRAVSVSLMRAPAAPVDLTAPVP